MARNKTYNICAINISLVNHSLDAYINLFKNIFDNKKEVRLRGQYHAVPNVYRLKSNENIIIGSLYRYTDIDRTKPWLNKDIVKELIDENGDPIPQTEPNLAPNLDTIHFIFNLKHHRLFFVAEQISPNAMYKFFDETFKILNIVDISVTIEQSLEKIQEILALKHLGSIDIFINIPNPDDIGTLDHTMEQRLKNMNATSLNEKLKSKEDNLNPDSETKALMNLATSNGYVKARGQNDRLEKVELSTDETPMSYKMSHNKKEQGFLDNLIDSSKEFLKEILKKIKE